MLIVFFCTVFTIIIIKCKASFSCHSSSYHYSTQGFVLILFHFIFSFLKNKINKILCNFTCDLLLCLRISDLKCGQKTPKRMGPWEKTFPFFFWSHLLAIISRNVGTKGHLRKEIVLTKCGGQFELLNWLEKSTRLFKLKLKLELKLEDYDIVHFTIR